jgi:hypothetical protein
MTGMGVAVAVAVGSGDGVALGAGVEVSGSERVAVGSTVGAGAACVEVADGVKGSAAVQPETKSRVRMVSSCDFTALILTTNA